MAFVAEYISKEGLEKYDIINIINTCCRKYNEEEYSDYLIDQLCWVIDRQRGVWLISVVNLHLPDHRDGWSGERIWVLHYDDQDIELDLRDINNKNTSTKITDNPFKILYELKSIKTHTYGISRDEIVKILKDALEEYRGAASLNKFVPKENIQVTFISKDLKR